MMAVKVILTELKRCYTVFVDDDYMDKVSDVEPKDEDKPKREKRRIFAGALSKLAEK